MPLEPNEPRIYWFLNFKKINKIMPYIIILGTPAIILFEFIVLKLYGKKYPVNFSLIFLFSLGATIILLNSNYTWLMASVGKIGAKISMYAVMISGSVNILLNRILIPKIGITGAIIATIIAYLFSFFFLISKEV